MKEASDAANKYKKTFDLNEFVENDHDGDGRISFNGERTYV